MSNGNTISEKIEEAVGEFVMETNLEPTEVYISPDTWLRLLYDHGWNSVGYKSATVHNAGYHTISFLTIYGNVKLVVKYDMPSDKVACNPVEYEEWLNDMFEKEILIGDDE